MMPIRKTIRAKIVIFIPNKKLPGGISNYYYVARKYFSSDVIYTQGNSSLKSGIFKSIINGLYPIVSFFKLIWHHPTVVVLNPSLGTSSLIREGLISCWNLILGYKTIIFWRGWNPEKENILERRAFALLFNISYLKASKHICLNTHVCDNLIKRGVPPQKIRMSNTIVDDTYFNESSKKKSNKFVILFLTRIEKYKGIYEAIHIFRELSDKLNMELHIAGSGSELENIKKIISKEKIRNVKFLGFLNDTRKMQAYKSSSCYLFPSYSEGMPNSVLEAMACGLPIISTRVGALNDFFVDGKMGFSFPLPIVIEEFKKAIEVIFFDEELRITIQNFNRNYAKEHFRASTSITRIEEIFNEY
jgi:glycosyltransferase involved in cell wall biosynthesis